MEQQRTLSIITTIGLILLLSIRVAAQKVSPMYDVSLRGGPSLFWGDLSVNEDQGNYLDKFSEDNNWSAGVNFSYRALPFAKIGVDFSYGQLNGVRDKYNKGSLGNQDFQSQYIDYGLMVKLNVVDLLAGYNNNRFFSGYLMGGFGVVHYRAKATQLSTGQYINTVGYDDLGQEKTDMAAAMRVPLGAGLQFSLNDHLNINLETYLNRTNIDNLDANVGNTEINDMYSFTSLGVSYKFGEKQKQEPQLKKEPKPAPEPVIAEEPVDVEFVTDMPQTIQADTTISVYYAIKKDNLHSSGKFWQTLPMGVKAVSGDAKGAEFSFEDQTISFQWDSMPAGDEIEMDLDIKIGSIAPGEYELNGIFFYEESGQEKNKEFVDTFVVEEEKEPVVAKKEPKPEPEPSKSNITYRVQLRAIYDGKQSSKQVKNAYGVDKEVYEHFHDGYAKYSAGDFNTYEEAQGYKMRLRTEKGVEGAFVVAFRNGKRLNSLDEIDKPILENEPKEQKALVDEGIYYRVQVAAISNKKLSAEEISEKYNIDEQIEMENSGGWHRYVVGMFDNYSSAKEKLVQVRDQVPGAFIVKYKDGQRI